MAIERYDQSICIGCGNCLNTCPCDVFRLLPEERGVRIAYREDCQTCFACELDCPEDAIDVGPMRMPRRQAW